MTHKQLNAFIKQVENYYFRTVEDVGAHPNAMLIWNQVRIFAGLPRLSKEDLSHYDEIQKQYITPRESKLARLIGD